MSTPSAAPIRRPQQYHSLHQVPLSLPPRRHNRAALRLLRPYLPGGHIRQLPRHLRRLGHAIHAKRHQLLHRQPRLGRRLHRGLLHTLPGNLSTSSADKELECNNRAFLVFIISEYLGPTMYKDIYAKFLKFDLSPMTVTPSTYSLFLCPSQS